VDHIVLLGTPDFVLLGTQSTCKALERKAFRNRNARDLTFIFLLTPTKPALTLIAHKASRLAGYGFRSVVGVRFLSAFLFAKMVDMKNELNKRTP
jgi:hypothetical protein